MHQDVGRLVALANPTLPQETREAIACDYYIEAMDYPDFALTMRERAPATLDEALRVALQLEAWGKDARRTLHEGSRLKTKAGGATGRGDNGDSRDVKLEQLSRRIEELVAIMKIQSTRPSSEVDNWKKDDNIPEAHAKPEASKPT